MVLVDVRCLVDGDKFTSIRTTPALVPMPTWHIKIQVKEVMPMIVSTNTTCRTRP